MGGLHQEDPKERAPRFAQVSLAVLLAGMHDRRIETGIPLHLFGPGEAMGSPRIAHVAAAPIKPMPVIVKST